MPTIHLETYINAPREVCFDLARNIDAHCNSTGSTSERAVAGRTSGLIELGETVTFEATHFGVRQRLTSKITQFERPDSFADEMQRGAFKSLRHLHGFEEYDGGTLMRDTFVWTSPLGILGNIADSLVLKRYLRRFLITRNAELKRMAESRTP
jgi:ligand-binding SRPBCC domain-containing protein